MFASAPLTSALSAVAGPATVPVVGVEHGDVATLVFQVHVLLQFLQRFVHTHVGVGELCPATRGRKSAVLRDIYINCVFPKVVLF